MDFTVGRPALLALTHFCDLHGPRTILCTQVRPIECTSCISSSPQLRNKSSFESYATQIPDDQTIPRESTSKRPLRRVGTDLTSDSEPSNSSNKNIEAHPLFRRNDCTAELNKTTDTKSTAICASCTFTVPQKVAEKIPEGAPGSIQEDGKSKGGPPVLRSRESICLGKGRKRHNHDEPSSSHESQDSSLGSYGSSTSRGTCHNHTLTYLTSRGPDDQETFAKLGMSVIRALSCEVLPRGMSEGPFCFGDTASGYTIAYVFRLTDFKARGRRRAYAFVALAGRDANRAFKACPLLWKAFETMSKTIEQAAQRYQDEQEMQQQKAQDEEMSRPTQSGYTPISSFLTQRPRDPDGQPRRAGQTQPRSLAEIIGDENIFAILHQYFVHVLRCLGERFGGVPIADEPSTDHQPSESENNARPNKMSARSSSDLMADLSIDTDDDEATSSRTVQSSEVGTPTPLTARQAIPSTLTSTNSMTVNDRPSSKQSNTGSTRTVKRDSQCADTVIADVPRPRQVVV